MDKTYSKNLLYWTWFVTNKQEELYAIITQMIDDKIKELVPYMIEEQLRNKIDRLSFNIQTTINGKSVSNIKDSIAEMIVEELSK